MLANILLVEDDASARAILSSILSEAGYCLDQAATGTEALQLLQRAEFELVLSDIRLPDIDGLRVLKAAMQMRQPPAVILLTGHGSVDTAVTALRSGASDYLLKPCTPQALLAAVGGAIARRRDQLRYTDALSSLTEGVAQTRRRRPPMAAQVGDATARVVDLEERVTIGSLTVGRGPHEVYYRSQPVHLTPIEFSLLRCLAEAQGAALSYAAIVQHTHGLTPEEVDAQLLLRPHVRNIRRKIAESCIVTVRNLGYRLGLEGEG